MRVVIGRIDVALFLWFVDRDCSTVLFFHCQLGGGGFYRHWMLVFFHVGQEVVFNRV